MSVNVLTDIEKQDIYDEFEAGATKASLAREYGVSTRTIGRVIDEVQENLEKLEEIITDHECFEEWDHADEWDDEEEQSYTYIVAATSDSLFINAISYDGYSDTVNVDKDHPRFEEASELVWSNRASQESLAQAFELLNAKRFIEKYSNGVITVDPEAGTVSYNVGGREQAFSGRLVPRLIQALSDGGPDSDEFLGLVSFAEWLTHNPSYRAVNELYNFLEATCIDIDKDGYVIAYKKVQEDYTDIHSGTFNNAPGSVCEVPRNMVDEDSERTCSYGLHVCSSSYLPFFGCSSSNRVVKVKVNPADFVAVPSDYNNAKARVSRYEVLADVTDQFYAEDDWMIA